MADFRCLSRVVEEASLCPSWTPPACSHRRRYRIQSRICENKRINCGCQQRCPYRQKGTEELGQNHERSKNGEEVKNTANEMLIMMRNIMMESAREFVGGGGQRHP